MRKVITIGVVFLFLLASAPGPALADSPHFIGTAQVSAISSDGSISVSFREAGLGTNQLITYTFAGSFTADYGCLNRGGNHPQATNKEFVASNFSVTGTFESGKNGSLRGTITFTPPDPNDILNCPGNQVAVLADISYSGLTLTDTTNNVAATLNITSESATFFTF